MVAGSDRPSPADVRGEGPPPRLYLHVGLAKTGTTFLQNVLRQHRDVLEEHGFCFPFVRRSGMFHASVEMTRSSAWWGLDPDAIEGTFAELVAAGRAHGGTVIISHEGFSKATGEQIAEIGRRLEGFEVHVVLTVRDLARTLTADWQERIKNGGVRSFEAVTAELLEPLSTDAAADSFWPAQNLEDTLRRWGALAPPERTHVVVCPQSGAPSDELLTRFAAAVGLPAHLIDLDAVESSNESLPSPQIALLRQVNAALDGRLRQPWHSRVSKRWFALQLLSRVPGPKPITPSEVTNQLEQVARRWIDLVETGGYHHYGDLGDLEPRPAPPGARHPDDVSAQEMLEGLPEVLAEMLLKVRSQSESRQEDRRVQAELKKELADTRRRLARAEEELRIRRRFWPFRVGPRSAPDPD